MPARDDAEARIERAEALRRQIARLKNPAASATGRSSEAGSEDESPQEFVERRMREIAKARSARKKTANKKVASKRRPAR